MAAAPGEGSPVDVEFTLGGASGVVGGDPVEVEYAGSGGALRFAVDPAGRRVWAGWAAGSPVQAVGDAAGLLLGPVLGGVLRLRGDVGLHGCVMGIGPHAVALLGPAGVGKSTIAATLAGRGHAVMSDDVVALTEPTGGGWLAHPGYPRLRVRPGTLAALAGPVPDGGEVITGIDKRYIELSLDPEAPVWRFEPRRLPLAALYLLERRSGAPHPEIRPVAGAAALAALVGQQRRPLAPLDPAGRARELTRLGALAAAVPVRRVECPEGLETVAATCDALVRDAASPALAR